MPNNPRASAEHAAIMAKYKALGAAVRRGKSLNAGDRVISTRTYFSAGPPVSAGQGGLVLELSRNDHEFFALVRWDGGYDVRVPVRNLEKEPQFRRDR